MKKEDLQHLSVYDVERKIETYLEELYVSKPKEPRLKNVTPTEEELSNFLAEKELYKKQLEEYNVANDFYKLESERLYSLLEDIMKEDSGLNDIPEQYKDKVYNYAYEKGHSNGYSKVYYYLCGLVDIFN